MLYVWVENNTICATEYKEYAPKNALEFPDLTWNDVDKLYLDENGEIKIKSKEILLSEAKERKRQELKQAVFNLLSQTDWVVIKCLEPGLDLKKEYPEIKAKRDKIRKLNETYEKIIDGAIDLEKLENLVFDFSEVIK